MSDALMNRPQRFMKGRYSGLFHCASCGKRTRHTPETKDLDICPECYRSGRVESEPPEPDNVIRGADPGRTAKTVTVRRKASAERRRKAKSRSGSGDTLSGIDWSHPSLTPEYLKERERDIGVVELEVEASDNQRDIEEPLSREREPVMAAHKPIDLRDYLSDEAVDKYFEEVGLSED